LAHDRDGGLVGGKERLDRQFRERDIHRGAEHRRGAEERQRPVHRRQLEGHRHHVVVLRLRLARRTRRQRVIAHFLHEVGQHGIAGGFDLLPQPDDDVVPPFHQVDDARRQARRMQAQPDHIDRGRQQQRIDPGDQPADRFVRRRHGPMPIDRQSRIRIMHAQDQIDTLACRLKCRIVQ